MPPLDDEELEELLEPLDEELLDDELLELLEDELLELLDELLATPELLELDAVTFAELSLPHPANIVVTSKTPVSETRENIRRDKPVAVSFR